MGIFPSIHPDSRLFRVFNFWCSFKSGYSTTTAHHFVTHLMFCRRSPRFCIYICLPHLRLLSYNIPFGCWEFLLWAGSTFYYYLGATLYFLQGLMACGIMLCHKVGRFLITLHHGVGVGPGYNIRLLYHTVLDNRRSPLSQNVQVSNYIFTYKRQDTQTRT